jgi:anti-sigma regulatory factor (Ser/Thr protein kinase)
MDPFLIDRWIGDFDRLTVFDQASVSEARERARAAAAQAGLSQANGASAALIASELATNHIRHARGGVIAARAIVRDGVNGVEIIAADRGEGIADPTKAIEQEASTAGGLGVGLSGVLRLADEVDFDVRLGQGTCVVARKFEQARRRREVAILGRPAEGERISGDDAIFVRGDDTLLVALADGLGHGPEASAAARAAVGIVRAAPQQSIPRLLRDAGAALVHTRGAAMSIIRIDEREGTVHHAGVGNVTTHVVGPNASRAFSGVSAVLGMTPARVSTRHPEEDAAPIGPWDVVYAFTDGLSTRTLFDVRTAGGRRHPLLVADALLKAFGRKHDDATILVAS